MLLAVKPNRIKLFVLLAGVLGLILRSALFATGLDTKGLLVTGHWADISSWLLTAGVIGLIFLTLHNCSGPNSYEVAFPGSLLRSAGSMVAACGFLLSAAPATGKFALAEPILRILSVAALIAVAYCRFRGKQPSLLFHGVVCLYLALRMVCLYQLWSADPQLQHYAFYLGAHVALMLCCYQLAAFDGNSGSHRSLWGWGLGAMYLCLAAIPACQDAFFPLCCTFWILSSLSNLTPASVHEGD